jgi:hypothetical protein
MALPKLEVPTYELELPISKKKIKFRPFLVKEQKILLMAMESGDRNTIQNSVTEILKVCTLTENFDIFSIPIIDIEYYFMNLRAKSVSEMVETKYRCNNTVTNEEGDSKECGNTMESKINLTEIVPTADKTVDPEIKITDKIIIKMKYPEFGIMKDSSTKTDIADMTFNMIASCIEYIFDGEQFYYAHETPREELIEFIDGLNQEQFEKMEEFFNNMPKLRRKVEMTCAKCRFNHSFDVEGLENFFG